MSDVAKVLMPDLENLRPEDLIVDPKFDIRKYGDGDPNELSKVERLSRTIERDGQLDAGIVIPHPSGNGKYVLIAGHRRRRAYMLANERRSANGQSLLKMTVKVDRSGGDPLRKACVSNMQREQLTPMELATLISRIRSENNWLNFVGAKKVAEYLGIDVTTVTQHDRFLSADEATKRELQDGTLTAHGAFTMLTVKPAERADVIERAKGKQRDIDARKITEPAIGHGDRAKVAPPSDSHADNKEREDSGKLTQPAIIAAIRDTPDVSEKPIPRTRKELIEFFMGLDGPAYGFSNGATRQFVDYFCNAFAVGSGTEKTMLRKFDSMVAGSDPGTESSRDKDASATVPEDKKTATGRLLRVDKGMEKPAATKKAKADKPVAEAKSKPSKKDPAKKTAKSATPAPKKPASKAETNKSKKAAG